MNADRAAAWGFAVSLTACLGLLSYERVRPDSLAVKTAETMLDRARAAGHPVELRTEFAADTPVEQLARADNTITQLLISTTDFQVRPSNRDALLFPASVHAAIKNNWVSPFLDVQDYEGATRGLARGYLDVLERAHEVKLLPRPVPLLGPVPDTADPNFHSTFFWGLPWALTTLSFGLWALFKARRQGLVTRHEDTNA